VQLDTAKQLSVPAAVVSALIAIASTGRLAAAQTQLPLGMRASIDSVAHEALARTGAPSASIAIVRDGQLAYANAYGNAHISPPLVATTVMRYSIGSVSKQFTATGILLLAEQGKLSLEDKVGRWLPALTHANDVTIRQILSMTSGYQDYWPQDYVMPSMLKPITAQQIVDQWGKKPLDFSPGTKWQYSNTNYVIAGLIIEKASGTPFVDFLRQNIFAPLHMASVSIVDDAPLGPADPERYLRYALGPLRPAPKEGKGWLFAAGELAMTPSDLAKWDESVIDQTILKPASYHTQQTTVLLNDGTSTGYGLGVGIGRYNGHRLVSHNGEVSGFTTQNSIFPDDRIAIVVTANLDATDAPAAIAQRVADILFTSTNPAREKAIAQTKQIFIGLQKGKIDRSLFTPNANAYFGEQALADYASSLAPLGAPTEVTMTSEFLRGGFTGRNYRVRCGSKTVAITTFVTSDGKLEQFQMSPA
jgi:CubicO group peptidase (beta-lactamase class C family)